MASPKSDNPVGRPSLYRVEYCDEVMNVMANGFSLTAFAGHIRVSRDTINEWMRVHPEFSVACKNGQALRTLYLEGGLLSGEAAGPQITARIFALKNSAPEEWRDRQDLNLSGNIAVEHSIDVSSLSDQALREIAKLGEK